MDPLHLLAPSRFETPLILKQMARASRKLAEFKGIAETIPRQDILINSLGLQEAKDSSAIENIVTTHDELFREDLNSTSISGPASKEVFRYKQALFAGFNGVIQNKLLTSNHILEIQATLEDSNAGFRKIPGTTLRDGRGATVYTPPQPDQVIPLMSDLEKFINDETLFEADPLIKMALIHHQFESIHPFYDGNGRTGRIINVLYLVKEELLTIPILYLSRYIVKNKTDYYRLLQEVRTKDNWEDWVLYMLKGVEETAEEGIVIVQKIKIALLDYKKRIREKYRFYSQDLINNLFMHPYTKIEFVKSDLSVSKQTAFRHLEELAKGGFVVKHKVGKMSYYINPVLVSILTTDT